MLPLIEALAVILLAQAAGTVLAGLLGLPIPGAVLGLGLLLAGLLLRGRSSAGLDVAAGGLQRIMGVLFVAPGVGLLAQGEILQTQWLAIGIAVLISTLLSLLAAAGAFLLVRRLGQGTEGRNP